MEFFSRDPTAGDHGERRSRYRRHVETLELPPRLGELALRDLGDSRLRRIVVDRRTRQVILFLSRSEAGAAEPNGSSRGTANGAERARAEVEILYHRVDLERLDARVLETRAADPQTVLVAGEMDRRHDGLFVHRLLFHPEGEIELAFRDAAFLERSATRKD